LSIQRGNVSISNNIIRYNASELVEQDDSPSVHSPIQLSAGFRIVNKAIWTNPGARDDISLIQLCNMQYDVMAGNKVPAASARLMTGEYIPSHYEATVLTSNDHA
jgi:hypothetical protein